MSNRRDIQFTYNPHNRATVLDCSFIVDSANGNGFGVRSLKRSGRIASVYMQSVVPPPNTPALGIARTYAAFAASAITNTGSSVLTGNIGITPGSAITGFPPGTFTGVENVDNAAAVAAKAAAQVAYTDLQARTPTIIAAALDGQSLSAGVYKSAGGTFTLAQAGGGTLTLNGSATDVFVFQTATTLTTGAGGVPVITLTGGALPSNVYWAVGSSATINSGNAGTFKGNIIAQVSITDTLGGDVKGSLIALTGAVTFSAASTVEVQPLSSAGSLAPGNPNPAPGLIVVNLQDDYNRYLGGYAGFAPGVSGVPLAVNASNLVIGNVYIIVSLGTTTAANWLTLGVPSGIVPAVGVSFIALAVGAGAGSGVVEAPVASGSGIDHIEVIGDPNLMNSFGPHIIGSVLKGGMQFILACYSGGVLTPPFDNTVIGLNFYMNNSAQGV